MIIKHIDRTIARMIREAVEDALKPVTAKLGIEIVAGSGTFTSTSFRFKVEALVKAADGTVETQERLSFRAMAHVYGLSVDDLDKTFVCRGEEYQIIGLRARARRNPIEVKRLRDGKVFVFSAEAAKIYLKAGEASKANLAANGVGE